MSLTPRWETFWLLDSAWLKFYISFYIILNIKLISAPPQPGLDSLQGDLNLILTSRMTEMSKKKLSSYSQGNSMVSLYNLTVSMTQSWWQRARLFVCVKIILRTFIPHPKQRSLSTHDTWQRHWHLSNLFHPIATSCWMCVPTSKPSSLEFQEEPLWEDISKLHHPGSAFLVSHYYVISEVQIGFLRVPG